MWIVCISAACLATTIVGCGRSGPERVVVVGKVTYRGKPVKAGEIRFIPAKGTSGPSWGALITDGQYTANGKGGVPVGLHRVEIVATDVKKKGRGFESADVAKGAIPKQYLPAKYNSQSELEIAVESARGKIIQNFELAD